MEIQKSIEDEFTQNILDEILGWWIIDIPYELTFNKETLQIERRYNNKVEIVLNKCNSGNQSYISKLFQYTTGGKEKINKPNRMNGRNYYPIIKQPLPSIRLLDPTNKFIIDNTLLPYMFKDISMDYLICALPGAKGPGGVKSCTPYGYKIASSLIRIAATRIFADPEQSILELPVNSIDAYKSLDATDKIGKFGMGFFSFLYWLIDHPKRYLTIISYYKEPSMMHG